MVVDTIACRWCRVNTTGRPSVNETRRHRAAMPTDTNPIVRCHRAACRGPRVRVITVVSAAEDRPTGGARMLGSAVHEGQ